jgi:hypothetical protein
VSKINPEELEAWLRRHVDPQPPLTAEQREQLHAVLGPVQQRRPLELAA